MDYANLRGRFLGYKLVQYLTDSGEFLAWTMLMNMGAGEREVRFCSCDSQVVSLVKLLGDDGVCAQVSATPLVLRPSIGFLAHRIVFGRKAQEPVERGADAAAPTADAHAPVMDGSA
jgi:hypothetical protein